MDAVNGSTGQYTLRADGIYFLMQDGRFEVICRIDLQTLSQFGKTINQAN